MTDWITIAASGGAVCVGAGLTMLGQYFSDRRSYARDREARREEFRITNYEIQRSALLELQEIVIKLSNTLTAISMRSRFQDVFNATFPDQAQIVQWYHMRERLPEWAERISEGYALTMEARQSEALSAERRREIAARLKELAEEFRNIPKQFDTGMEFFSNMSSLTDRLKILAARAGDDKVFTCCQELEQMIDHWVSAKDFKESDRQIHDIKQQGEQALDAISNALRQGPLS